MLQAASLSKLARIRHAFFTRSGGVSQGVYASLNGGVGSNDAPDKVAENRARMAAALGVPPDRLLTAYQIHSPDVVVADQPWTRDSRPRADAIGRQARQHRFALGLLHVDAQIERRAMLQAVRQRQQFLFAVLPLQPGKQPIGKIAAHGKRIVLRPRLELGQPGAFPRLQ